MKFMRSSYTFTHPKATGPVTFKAWSENGAWHKMKKFVIRMMYGDWALSYNPRKVDEVMKKVKLVDNERGVRG
jgi:hypothetical protein